MSRHLPDPTEIPIHESAVPNSSTRESIESRYHGVASSALESNFGPEDARHWLQLPLLDLDVHQSYIRDFRRCKRFGLLRYRFGIDLATLYWAPTSGTVYHLCMELACRGADWPTIVAQAKSDLHELAQLANKHGREYSSDDLHRALELGKAMAAYTLRHYPIGDDWRPLAVEEPVRVLLKGGKVPLGGRMDTLFLHLVNDNLYLFEYKTIKDDPAEYVKQLPYAIQLRHYRVLAEAWKRKYNVTQPLAGIVYYAIKRCTLKFGTKKDGGDPAVYLRRVTEWYDGTGEFEKHADVRKAVPLVRRELIPFGDEPLIPGEFATDLYETQRAMRALPLLDSYPRNDDMCLNWFGRPCKYRPMCHNHPRYWREIMHRVGYTVQPPELELDLEELNDTGD